MNKSLSQVKFLQDIQDVNPFDGNIDVEVKLADGSRYAATFFTLSNLQLMLERYRRTGECRNGLYLWASDMILIQKITREAVCETIEDLIAQGELQSAFSQLE